MKTSKQIVLELKRLNSRLDEINLNNRYMVYNASPWKFAWFNFLAGIFHSLGTLFGTAVVAAALVYLLGRFNVTKIFSDFLQSSLQQIQWQQIIPTPSYLR